MKRQSTPAVIFAALLVSFGGSAGSAEPGPANGPCSADMKKFCADTKPGDGRLVACMKQHEAELSQQCRAQREQARANSDAFQSACGDDVQKNCADVQVGGGRIFACLSQKRDTLTAACKEHLDARAQAKPKKPKPPVPKT